ncbi:MAG: flagellar basal body rod protein FlgC [Rhodomicrobium sp.]
MDNLAATFAVASSALNAQSQRIRVATENLANAESTGNTPGAIPYTRKLISFESELDQSTGASLVTVAGSDLDTSPYRIEKIPGHPAADRSGNVKLPNVNVAVELADIREGTRSYDANVQVIKQARDLVNMTIDLLRTSS